MVNMPPREAKMQHALAVAEELGYSPAYIWASERAFGAEFAARSVEIMVRNYHCSTFPTLEGLDPSILKGYKEPSPREPRRVPINPDMERGAKRPYQSGSSATTCNSSSAPPEGAHTPALPHPKVMKSDDDGRVSFRVGVSRHFSVGGDRGNGSAHL